ncbi:MAG: WD40 repeat domain-containing protein [Candidatus Poribacteria bacterium]
MLDVATGVELRVFVAPAAGRPRGRDAPYSGSPLAKHAFRIVRLIGDGRLALDITRDGGFVVRDVDTGEAVRVFEPGPEADYPCVLSPDHSLLVTGDVDGSAHIWDVATGRHLRTLVGHTGRVLSASFDLKNSMVATGGMDGVVRLWEAGTGVCLGAVPTSVSGAHAVSLSPDGRYLLTWRRRHYAPAPEDHPPAHPPSRGRIVRAQDYLPAQARLWDLGSMTELPWPSAEGVQGFAWRGDSQRLYAATLQGGRTRVASWALEDVARRSAAPDASAWVRPAIYRPGESGVITLLSMSSAMNDTPYGSGMLPFDMYHGVSRLSVSGTGATFAFTGDDGSVDIWRRRAD